MYSMIFWNSGFLTEISENKGFIYFNHQTFYYCFKILSLYNHEKFRYFQFEKKWESASKFQSSIIFTILHILIWFFVCLLPKYIQTSVPNIMKIWNGDWNSTEWISVEWPYNVNTHKYNSSSPCNNRTARFKRSVNRVSFLPFYGINDYEILICYGYDIFTYSAENLWI